MTIAERIQAEQRRLILQREINNYPVIIDRRCHRKTAGERDLLKEAKLNYSLTVPVGYKPKTIAKV